MARKKADENQRIVGKLENRDIQPLSVTHKVSTRPAVQRVSVEVARQDRLQRIRDIEDSMLEKSLRTIDAALSFAEVPFDVDEMTEEFRENHGPEAEVRWRTIKAAQLSSKHAPVGLTIAQKVADSIVSARSREKQAEKDLGVQVMVVTSAPVFEEMEVDD